LKKITAGIVALLVVFGLTIGAVSAEKADSIEIDTATMKGDPGSGGGG
jgi:hypothetical protein